jgi:putative ABC transport system permease protein
MAWREPARIALETLWSHKLRSFLTLLGVIISVTTLIGVISIISGMNQYVAERVANLGANVFYVTRFPIITNAKDYLRPRATTKRSRSRTEYLRERPRSPRVGAGVGATAQRAAEPEGSASAASRQHGVRGRRSAAAAAGTSPRATRASIMVAFVGSEIVEQLFSNVDPLGKTVYVDGRPFQVVGVGEKVGSTLGQSQDDYVCVPLSTFMKVWGSLSPRSGDLNIGIRCASPGVMAQAMDQARVLMRVRRGLKPDDKDAFGIIASDSLTDLWDQIFGGLAAVAVAITSVFLVVGGIVIMNIMLASVTERTHEIGVRKSLGARYRDILMQFLVESSVLSTTGGVVGVLAALGLTQLVAALTPVPMHTKLSAIVTPVLLSTAVGLFFGIYPARKAAKLDPVVALRAE